MKVYLSDSSVFDDIGCFDSLLKLFIRVRSEVHGLIVHDMDGLRQSRFYRDGIPEYQKLEWREWIERQSLDMDFRWRSSEPGARPDAFHADVVMCTPVLRRHYREISVWDVGDWSNRPLRLLLEDDSDFALWVGAARAYDACAKDSNSWLELAVGTTLLVDGRGGCGNVWATLKEASPEARVGDRILVIVDSDRGHPDEELKSPLRNILAAEAQFHEAKCIVLNKREHENYIPASHFQQALPIGRKEPEIAMRKKFGEWKRLSDVEKDFDNLDARFTKKWVVEVLKGMSSAETFTAAELDRRAGSELREVLQIIRERL